MSQWKYIGSVVALSLSAALGATGCLAQQGADDATSEPELAAAQPDDDAIAGALADEQPGAEKIGDAKEACGGFGGWGGFGGCGGFLGGGCAGFLGGCGGFGLGGYGCLGGGYFGGFPPIGFAGGCWGGGLFGGFGGCGGCF